MEAVNPVRDEDGEVTEPEVEEDGSEERRRDANDFLSGGGGPVLGLSAAAGGSSALVVSGIGVEGAGVGVVEGSDAGTVVSVLVDAGGASEGDRSTDSRLSDTGVMGRDTDVLLDSGELGVGV